MLKGNEKELAIEGADKKLKLKAIRHMSRILFALYNYICAFDDGFAVQERAHPPLLRSCIGNCFLLPVLFPSHELEKMRRHLEQKENPLNFEFSTSNSITNSQNEECMISVHSNMSLAAVRILIEEQLRQFEGFSLFDARFKLYALRLGTNSGEQIILDTRSKRKTLRELFIDANTQIAVSFSFSHHNNWSHRFPSSDSSLDGSDELSSAEEDAECILPGSVIAANSENVRFLCKLADIGYSNSCHELRDSAEKVLHQIPADKMSVSSLEERIKAHSLSDLFAAEKPSLPLYLLAVLHSLLLPANAHLQEEATTFQNEDSLLQRNFFASTSCFAVVQFLDDPQIFSRWDASACCTALWWTINILKFMLSVVARLRYLQAAASEKVLMFQSIQYTLSKDQQLHEKYCDKVANDLHKRRLNNEFSLSHLETLFTAKNSRLEALIQIAWVVGSRQLPLMKGVFPEQIDAFIAASLPLQSITGQQEQLTICTLDALTCASISEGGTELLLEKICLWNGLIADLLFSCSSSIRRHVVQMVKRIICRDRLPNMHLGDASLKKLAATNVNLLFEKFFSVDSKPEAASEYFSLLCRLLEYCRGHVISLDSIMERIGRVLTWLDEAKRHTVVHMENYPNDALLVGHFELCRSLVNFLTPENKVMIGSDPNGRNLVKQLLDDFVLPSSRAFLELERCKDDTEKRIQRSATQSKIIGSNFDYQSSIPRSVTIDPIPCTRCVPVCGTSESVKAAYDLLISLCEEAPQNYFAAVEILMEMFYSGSLPTSNIDWEYLPGFVARLPNNYVGLKNGGATCYMNSVFQQIFMIERLRNSVLNAKCTVDVDVDDAQFDDRLSIFRSEAVDIPQKDYHQTVLKSVQTIFAHLLGSELQFYTPKFFWNHFRFGGQAVNVREQQDALEFYNAIFDSIDEGMKAIGEPPICEVLFGGTFADQKICKDCPHRYQREEGFTSISVDIRSHNNLIASLKEYVKGDLLNNDNAYFCEECGCKVTAVKRLCLAKLPPYLTIQLKRFDFDWEREVPQKYNDYFEFPLQFDMMPYTAQGLAESEAESIKEGQARSPFSVVDSGNGGSVNTTPEKLSAEASNLLLDVRSVDESCTNYRLRGVVVHSGQANGGHYYSFIRSEEDGGQWYKFDDIDVTKWQLSKDEMRNMWFGGDYVTDSYDGNCKGFQKRRQKRWWNAYLLIYEKVFLRNSSGSSSQEMSASFSSAHASPSSLYNTSSNMDLIEKRTRSVSLSNRLRQMPPKLEALIRGKNTRSMHERSQYTPQYFQLIRELTSCAVRLLERNFVGRKEVCMHTTRLLSKFLFSTALKAKKSLRGGNMCEWQKNLERLLSASEECRAWFVCNVIFQPKLIVLFLLSATALDVRHFFANIICTLLDLSRKDSIENLQPFLVDCSDFKLEMVYSPGDSVSDVLLSLLLIVPRNNFNEFTSHPAQYFLVFHQYAALGLEQKKQMVRKGVLHSMLILLSQESCRIKLVCHDAAKFFDVISLLLRTCDFGLNSDNPYAIASSDLELAPQKVKELVEDSSFLDRFLKQLLELPSSYDIASTTLCFLCWENLHFSKSMFTLTEVRQATELIESLTSIEDSVKTQRVRYALFGSNAEPKHKGYIATLYTQRDFLVWKTYTMFKSLLRIVAKNPEVNQMLLDERDSCDMLFQMEDWLKRHILRNASNSYGSRSNEMKQSSDLELTGSATDLLASIKQLNANIAKNAEVSAIETKKLVETLEDENFLPAVQMHISNPFFDNSFSGESDGNSNDTNVFPQEWTAKLLERQGGWQGDDQVYVPGSVSVKEKLASTKNLPPPPAYSEIQKMNELRIHANSPVHLLPGGDSSDCWRKTEAVVESRTEASSPEFVSTGTEVEDCLPTYEEASK